MWEIVWSRRKIIDGYVKVAQCHREILSSKKLFFFKLLLKKRWRGCDHFFPSFAQYPRVWKNQIIVREEKGKEWIGEERGGGELSRSGWITQWHSIKNRRANKIKIQEYYTPIVQHSWLLCQCFIQFGSQFMYDLKSPRTIFFSF